MAISRYVRIPVIAFVLLAIVLIYVGWSRNRDRKRDAVRMQYLLMSMGNYYEATKNELPAVSHGSGISLSWRVLLQRVCNPRGIDYRFYEMWDSPHNMSFVKNCLQIPFKSNPARYFQCQSDLAAIENGFASHLRVTGKGTLGEHLPIELLMIDGEDIPDGADKTILVVRVLDSKVIWTSTEDFDVMNNHNDAKILAWIRSDEPMALFADGSVRVIAGDTSLEEIRSLSTHSGNEKVDIGRHLLIR